MAVVVVQAASVANNTIATNDITASFSLNVTAGNAIISWAQSAGGGSPPAYVGSTMTDLGLDAFTFLGPANDGVNDQYGGLWFCNSSAGGFKDVTFKDGTTLGVGAFSTMTVFEVSGLAANASDTGASNLVAAGAGSSATNGDTSGSFSVSQTGELIVAGFFTDTSGTAQSWTAGTSPIAFTIPTNGSTSLGGSNPHVMEYAVWTGSGPVNPTITLPTTDGYIAIGWGFKAVGGGGGGNSAVASNFSTVLVLN